MTDHGEQGPLYSEATAVQAEGARVGVVTCLRCGVALLLDPRSDKDVIAMHNQFHAEAGR